VIGRLCDPDFAYLPAAPVEACERLDVRVERGGRSGLRCGALRQRVTCGMEVRWGGLSRGINTGGLEEFH
jgi:hypothetical protein